MRDSSNRQLVTTLAERCRICFTCVRECPAKAIRIANGQADVIAERCIGCGNCIRVCSQKAKKIFDKARNEDNLEFIYKMEEGTAQESPELQKIHDVLRETLDAKREEIRALGTGKLDKFIENYFPHIWEKPNAAKKKFLISSRP